MLNLGAQVIRFEHGTEGYPARDSAKMSKDDILKCMLTLRIKNL